MRESKTLATITFQNFFRLYDKLSGMTGTAMTEEAEFQEIYKLDVIEIPTNKPVVRIDRPDVIYKTENAKFNAVIDQIAECHEKGQPVLVGTISIDKSEHLSSMLKRRGIKHEVLNAKYHEKEAEIIAQAGKKGAVTIATNMAGRGTDIALGGNPEYLAKHDMRRQGYTEEQITQATSFAETDDEEILHARKVYQDLNQKYKDEIKPEAEAVKEAGGLFILGTERHESRRIDNQLRGRSGRQGDPGESRFFLSAQDDLMRLFGGERIQNLMEALKIDEDQPIENKMLSNSIESAQRKVEGRNFSIRKNVLQYDDVMNRQREIIYGQRAKVLDGEDIHESILSMIKETIEETVAQYLPDSEIHDDWNMVGLRDHYMGYLTGPDDLNYTVNELADMEKADISKQLIDKAMELYEGREKLLGPQMLRELERVILLEIRHAVEHGSEYRLEGFDMFDEMVASIRADTVRLLLTIQLKSSEELKREQVAKPTTTSLGGEKVVKKQPVRKQKIGRNDPCPCGSGKKYKKCCGMHEND